MLVTLRYEVFVQEGLLLYVAGAIVLSPLADTLTNN
jgi:hypothetical protein